MQVPSFGRRALLAALVAWSLAAALPAAAQDPRTSEAHAATLAWLALADADDGAGTYREAAQRFRDAITQEQWNSSLKEVRTKNGKTVRRTFVGAHTPQPGKDTPPGDYILVLFRTEFAQRDQATETVTLQRDPDGKFRVVGYLIR